MTRLTSATIDCPEVGDAPPAELPRLTVIVPCYNEAESLSKLSAQLFQLRAQLARSYETELLFVDDGSSDATWRLLKEQFADDPTVRLVQHEANRGIAAAIGTGIREAASEIVASIDADGTYEAVQLVPLLRRLTDDVDVVVASPYHPEGKVVGVPHWRLALSRLASRLYALVMRNQLHTYTSCFRIYRKSSVVDLPLSRGGFVGVVELLWQLDRQGGTIAECPAMLTVRTTGHSKMRTARTALAHLRLLAEAAWQRITVRPPKQSKILSASPTSDRTSRFATRTN